MDLLDNTLRLWAQYREFRAVLRELESYSDRELAELGIARGDVTRLAYEEAERRVASPAPAAVPEASAPAREASVPVIGWYRARGT
jgi:uncharacterized protein YjiS (DUF1127 family)